MPKSAQQKQKLLLVADYFEKYTDENNVVTTPRIIEYLEAQGIKAERKSIYDDIKTLTEYGMDIVKTGGTKGGYFLASRDFELAEVKLLVDLVQSSKFITTKKSRSLISKLEGLASKNAASTLHRQVVVAKRNKSENESIYYSVDKLYEAMANNSKILFNYFEWGVNKERVLRKNGELYEISPWLLTWYDENYYLIGYDSEAEMIKYFRVDKMLNISANNKAREGRTSFEEIDIAALSKKTFGMFAGDEKTVQLLCDKSMTGVIIDRLGKDVALRPYDDNQVLARANIEVSVQFFGWLSGLAGKVKIYGPKEVALDYKKYLQNILAGYDD